MEHQYVAHTVCHNPYCMICEGGLSLCRVCGGAEGALTSDCCGRELTSEEIDQVHKGAIDFRDGAWVQISSVNSPKHYIDYLRPLEGSLGGGDKSGEGRS